MAIRGPHRKVTALPPAQVIMARRRHAGNEQGLPHSFAHSAFATPKRIERLTSVPVVPYLHERPFLPIPVGAAAIVRLNGPESLSVESSESIIVGTAIQFSGTILVTILCAIMLRSIRRQFLYYWAAGWCALSVALAALLVGFSFGARDGSWQSWQWIYFAIYCFGEYTAGFLWIAGCRNLFGNYRLTRHDWVWCIPAAIIAGILPWIVSQYSGKFDGVMVVHSLLMACLFATAFAVLYASRQASHG